MFQCQYILETNTKQNLINEIEEIKENQREIIELENAVLKLKAVRKCNCRIEVTKERVEGYKKLVDKDKVFWMLRRKSWERKMLGYFHMLPDYWNKHNPVSEMKQQLQIIVPTEQKLRSISSWQLMGVLCHI